MDKFNLTFNGRILDGFEVPEVKKRFAEALLINDPERVEQFFSGKTVTIRRNLDKETATAFYTKMYRVGVVLKLEPTHAAPIRETFKPRTQREFRKERPGSVDQSWPIPSSNPKAKKTAPQPINEPGNAVKQAEEEKHKLAAEEQTRIRDEEFARIEAERVRRAAKEVAIREAEALAAEDKAIKDAEAAEAKRDAEALAAKKRVIEEAARVRAEEKRKHDEEAARAKAEQKRIEAEKVAKRKAEALAAKKKAAEEATRARAEEKRERDEEAARLKAEQKRIKAEEAAKRKADALAAKKKAAEEVARARTEEKLRREEEAARIEAEQKRVKAEEAAKRKAEALAAKKKAAEEVARARAEEKLRREQEAARIEAEQKRVNAEEAARAQAEEVARLIAEEERKLAQEIARKEAEKAALRVQTAAQEAKKKADEEASIQIALDKIARKKAEEEAAAQQTKKMEARKRAKEEEARLRTELAEQRRKNAQEAARAKADEERIENALRTLSTKRKDEEDNRNLGLKEEKQRQFGLQEAQKEQQRLAQEKAAERRAQERQMERAALERAAAGTARLEELQRASAATPPPASKTQRKPALQKKKNKQRKTPAKKPETAAKDLPSKPTVSPAITARKRQVGAPNLFNLKPFRSTAEIRQRAATSLQLMKVMYIASVVALLSLLILGARYALLPTPDAGVAHANKVIVDQHASLFIASASELFVLDRSGTDSKRYLFTDLGIGIGAALLSFDHSGKLIVQEHPGAGTDETSSVQRLLRCDLQLPICETFEADLPDGRISDWITDTRTGDSFVAIAHENSLSRLAQDGTLISQQTLDMSSRVKLIFHEGLLYINSSMNPAIGVFRPDEKAFGEQLDDILLLPQGAQEQGHTRVDDFLWSADSWWVIMTNPDTHNSALYRFNADWNYQSVITMAPTSVPQQLLIWSKKILVVDSNRVDIARFNSEGETELPLTPKALASDISQQQASLTQSRRLWYACLGFLAILGIVTYVLGRLHQLRALVYRADNVRGAEPIDDKVQTIRWIELDPGRKPAFNRLVALLASTAIVVIATLIYLAAPLNAVVAVIILFIGPATALALLTMSRPGHVGVLDGSLILVDHNNNYHIDGGARIHYRNNFLLLDDIAVYVGNKLMPVFSTEQLAQSIAPLARAGVKVDRKTVLVKLGQSAHPLTRGLIACTACLGAALFCLLLY